MRERSHDLDPHDMQSLIGVAFVENVAGSPEKAIEHLQHALRISPRDPMRPSLHQQLAMASFSARQYANGVAYALLGIGRGTHAGPAARFPRHELCWIGRNRKGEDCDGRRAAAWTRVR